MSALHSVDIQSAEPAPMSGDEMFRLGLAASTGVEGAMDLVTAHKWFNLAALNGSEAAKGYRRELAAEMSPGEVAEAQRQAREWLATHRPAFS
ncbi:MAG: hypothetical protein AAFR11_06660 [Pseudomonadota bacterium]